MTLKDVLAGLPTFVALSHAATDGERRTVVFDFSVAGFGFGEIAIVQDPSGVYVDSECMGPGKVQRLLGALLESATLDTDEDPEKHARYNAVMGRACAASCRACHSEVQP